MIRGQITISLEREPDLANEGCDRRALGVLDRCPDGASVIVRIGRRRFVSQDAACWLHEHDHRLQITIDGDEPEGVLRFVQAARSGEWSVVA